MAPKANDARPVRSAYGNGSGFNAINFGDGIKEKPFKRINQAAEAAMPGDEVLVMPGVYREDVSPLNAGKENNRIMYRSIIH